MCEPKSWGVETSFCPLSLESGGGEHPPFPTLFLHLCENSASGSEVSLSDVSVDLEDADDVDLDPEQRPGNTTWCDCQNCGTMDTVKESVCCQEVNAIKYKLLEQQDKEQDLSCITKSHRFHWICVDSDVLEVAMLSMADIRADSFQRPINSR